MRRLFLWRLIYWSNRRDSCIRLSGPSDPLLTLAPFRFGFLSVVFCSSLLGSVLFDGLVVFFILRVCARACMTINR